MEVLAIVSIVFSAFVYFGGLKALEYILGAWNYFIYDFIGGKFKKMGQDSNAFLRGLPKRLGIAFLNYMKRLILQVKDALYKKLEGGK